MKESLSKSWLAALGAAVAAALLLHLYLARYERELAGGEPRALLMVTRDLALGEVLREADLSVRAVPERYVEERQVRAADLSHVLGARIKAALGTGSTLRYGDLDVVDEDRTLAGLVRPGMRGYALSPSSASFDGLLRAGDRVDVVWAPADAQSLASTLLENVLVLTVGGRIDNDEHDANVGRRTGGITLSLSARQAELLAQRERTGRLLLTLRNPHDVELRASQAEQAGAP